MGFLHHLRTKKRTADSASALYIASVQQSRLEKFYTEWGVPDNVDGRFDLIVLHLMLLIRRLRPQAEETKDLSQEILNIFFADMDRNFREMGVGDMSVGKHVKKAAKAFYGRAEIIEEGLDGSKDALETSLMETLYRSVDVTKGDEKKMSLYVIETNNYLSQQSLKHILSGQIYFLADV